MKKVILLLMICSLTLMAFDAKKVYKQCAMCHGKHAEKIALKSSPRLNSLSKEELSAKLTGILDFSSTMPKRYLGVHKAKLKGVGQEDVEAFTKYILNLK